jgi:hypothetical protein
MFRFTIRDLLWLTLVVAVGLGWLAHQRQLRANADRAISRAATWRGAAGALEHVIASDGCIVDWQFYPSSIVCVWRYDGGGRSWRIDLTAHEPSCPAE